MREQRIIWSANLRAKVASQSKKRMVKWKTERLWKMIYLLKVSDPRKLLSNMSQSCTKWSTRRKT